MKHTKLLSVLLAVLLVITVFPLAASAETTGRYKVISDRAVLFAEPDITSAKKGELRRNTIVDVKDVSRRFGQITAASAGLTGWVQLSNLEYLGTPSAGTITGIKVIPPDKRTYTEDSTELDLTGMKVYAVYADGMQVSVTGYEVFRDSLTSLGPKEVRVTYTPPEGGQTFSDSFGITVERYPVSRLTVITRPDTVSYLENQRLDLTGLTVKLSYSDGRPEKLFTAEDIAADPDFTIDGCCGEKPGELLKKGTHTIYVSYRYPDILGSFSVTVKQRVMTSLTIIEQPDSLVTHSKEKMPVITGLKLLAEYDNGEKEEIEAGDCTIDCDPSKFILGENNVVDVWYGGSFVRLFYKLSLNEEVGIRVVPPQILSYVSGEKIDLTGMKVQLVYSDGTLENVTDYTMSEIDPDLTGSQNIIVTYGEYSDVFTISITPYYRKGDVNGDGKIEAEDARLALRTAVGFIHLTGLALNAGDIDKDGTVTSADARLILRASVGLEKFDDQ